MGTGYIRQSAAEIADTNIITALGLENEFDAIQSAFHAVTGHSHDGTSGEGPMINLTTSITGVLPIVNGGFAGKHKLDAIIAPTVNEDSGDGYSVGSHWIDVTADVVYTLVDSTVGAAVWQRFQLYDADLLSWGAVARAAGFDTFVATPSSANLAALLTDETGTGANVFATSPTLVTPALGTPSSGVLTNATGLPISTGVSGLAAGVATFLGTPSSANLASTVTDETGTGALVFANSPTLVTPALGTPASGVMTNVTGLPVGTGISGLGANVATFLATPSSLNLLGAMTDETGTGSLVFATSPTLVTPILGTPTSGTLTNATGLPISTGVSGLGANVATFLATPSSLNLLGAVTDETGTGALVFATSPTLVTPILGTPTSGTLTNTTGLPLTTGVTGTLPVANGGTAIASYTAGDTIYASAATTFTKVAKGTAGQVYTMNAGATAPEWATAAAGTTPSNKKIYTASDTWSKPAGLTKVVVTVLGGGGGSGGVSSAGAYAMSGAGAGGGAAIVTVLAASLAATETVTVGAGGTAGSSGNNAGGTGGTTSFGTLAVASGGSAGQGDVGGADFSTTGLPGITPGIGTTGDILIRGGIGLESSTGSITINYGGTGGASALGGGNLPRTTSGVGNAGAANTGAGAGSSCNEGSSTNRTGAVGGSGLVIVEEYF